MKIKSYPSRLLLLAIFTLLLGFGGLSHVSAQQVTYGNEWINYNQRYFKIQVPTTGIYRLDKAYLQAAGINGVDPRKIQIFRKGQEIPLYVAGQADGSFDASDYIEFYGEKNDGSLDKELYKDPSVQVNPYYSLYTDTAAYFLTWSAADGKRMIEQNPSPAGLTAESWYWQTRLYLNTDQYTRGKRYGENYMSWMDVGEGYASGAISSSADFTVDSILNVQTIGAKPTIEVGLLGSNGTSPSVEIYAVNGATTRLIGNTTFVAYGSNKSIHTLEFSDISSDGKIKIRVVTKNGGYIRLSYIKVSYPQSSVLIPAAISFQSSSSGTSPLYYSFSGNAISNAIAYDITNNATIYRIIGTETNEQKAFVFPVPNGTTRKGLVWGRAPLIAGVAKEMIFRSLENNKANYLIISHKALMQPSGTYSNPIRDYAAYRASAIGGGYDTLTMEIGQIYDQFFYGDKSSAAIRRFMKYMIAYGNPKHLFIIGKGLEADNVNARKNPNALSAKDLVPTGGTPGSDVFFTADWESSQYVPKVSTGRIPANTAAEVAAYLDKVKVHASLPQNVEWRKNILHLGGSEAIFNTYLSGYENIAEGPWLGAKVLLKSKNSVGGVDTLNVSKEVNAGLSLITFFGHSSTSVSELNIGLVSDPLNGYNNPGKYPMILMNGCNAGNSFITDKSFGEDWLLTPNKGAIAFLAHDSYGYPTLLNVYSTNFYKTTFADSTFFGSTIGTQYQKIAQLTSDIIGNADISVAMKMQMVLQGDPAVVLIGPEKPDYQISSSSIQIQSVDGRRVTANSSKFAIALDIKNLGKVNKEKFNITVKRTLENNQVILYNSLTSNPIYNRNTVVFELNAQVTDGSGINKFEVSLDNPSQIDELDENNNKAVLEYIMPKSGVIALAPQEYSLVKDKKVNLIGQSTDLLVSGRNYIFEVDTVYTFNSSIKKTKVITAATVPNWQIDLTELGIKDSTSIYWRFKYNDVVSQEDTAWARSSFRFIANSNSGWSQVFQGQFEKAASSNLQISLPKKKIDFGPVYRHIEIKAAGGALGMSRSAPYGIFIDGISYLWDNCGYTNPNIFVTVYNNTNLDYYVGIPNDGTAGFRCGLAPFITYQFSDLRVTSNQDRLENFLKQIPVGYHVAIMGINNVPYQTFKQSLKDAFKSLGSSLIDQLQEGDPFALIGQKGGSSGTAIEAGANASDNTVRNQQIVRVEKHIEGFGTEGTLTSSIVGPAVRWGTLHHQLKLESSDSYQLDVLGVNSSNEETVLFTDVKGSSYDLSSVNASTYPYLKLRLKLMDATQRTAPQIKQWTVLYEGVPEGILRPDLVGVEKYTKLSEQASTGAVDLRFAFHNVSDVSFTDSLTVQATVLKGDGGQTTKTFKVEPLQKNDTVYFRHSFTTKDMVGTNRLLVNVNPRILPEQSYLNNSLEIPFTIGQFNTMAPMLDVAFDGAHILDGDIVSPSPSVNILLKDNTGILAAKENQSVKVFLKKQGEQFAEISQTSHPDEVQVFAPTQDTDLRVEYHPKQLEDGTYTLQVQARDNLNNTTYSDPYEINFEVVNESQITNFYPYPNPFSSKTRFVFTLTGSVIPSKLKIQIMTVTGKVVKEIQKEELGPIKIGNNVTEYSWDGTDEYGDKLANGVYLYRVVMDTGADTFKHKFQAADKAFKNGYGKLYILR